METTIFENEVVVNTPSGKKAFFVVAEIRWKNAGKSGIGSYEYWGSSGFDEGTTIYEIDEIDLQSVLFFDEDDTEHEVVETIPQATAEEIVHYILENATPPEE